MTESLSRQSPLSYPESSPPPILISRTSQEIDNGVSEAVQDFDDLSSAIRGIVEDVQTTEPGSPTDGSSPKLESGNLMTSPFKIQKLRGKLVRPNELTSQQESTTVSKITTKLASMTHSDDNSDSELT